MKLMRTLLAVCTLSMAFNALGSMVVKRSGTKVYVQMLTSTEHGAGQFIQLKNVNGEVIGIGQVEETKGRFARVKLLRGDAHRGLAATSASRAKDGETRMSRLEEIENHTHMKLKVYKPFSVTASTQIQTVQDEENPVSEYRLNGGYEYWQGETFSTSSNILAQYRTYNQTLSDGDFAFDGYSAGFRQNVYLNIDDTFVPFVGAGLQRGMLRANGNNASTGNEINDEYYFTQIDLAAGVKVNINENFIFVAQIESNQSTIDTNYTRTTDGETETFELSDDIEQETTVNVFSLGIGIPF